MTENQGRIWTELSLFQAMYSWQSRQALPNGTRKPYSKYLETALFVTEKSCPKRHPRLKHPECTTNHLVVELSITTLLLAALARCHGITYYILQGNSRILKLSVQIQLSDVFNFKRKVKRDSDRTFFWIEYSFETELMEDTQWYWIA